MPTVSSPPAMHCSEEPGFVPSITSSHILEGCHEAPQSHLFSRLNKSSSLSHFLQRKCSSPQASWWPLLNPLCLVDALPCIEGPILFAISRHDVMSAEQRRMITSLSLLTMTLLHSPECSWPLSAKTHCWLLFILLCTRSPRAFSAKLLPSQSAWPAFCRTTPPQGSTGVRHLVRLLAL